MGELSIRSGRTAMIAVPENASQGTTNLASSPSPTRARSITSAPRSTLRMEHTGALRRFDAQLFSLNFCTNISPQVDRSGTVVRNAWEDCQYSCPTECVRWVDASDGDIPAQAFKNRGQPEYVVRARHEGGIYPGTFLAPLGEVDIPWRDQVISKSKYQELKLY